MFIFGNPSPNKSHKGIITVALVLIATIFFGFTIKNGQSDSSTHHAPSIHLESRLAHHEFQSKSLAEVAENTKDPDTNHVVFTKNYVHPVPDSKTKKLGSNYITRPASKQNKVMYSAHKDNSLTLIAKNHKEQTDENALPNQLNFKVNSYIPNAISFKVNHKDKNLLYASPAVRKVDRRSHVFVNNGQRE